MFISKIFKFPYFIFHCLRMSSYTDLFNKQDISKCYSSRPDYSEEVIGKIINYWKKYNPGKTVDKSIQIVDVGCGTGQLTAKLLPYAKRIIGMDISESQIQQAQTENLSDIEFCVSSCHQMPCADSSVDLVSAAQCVHWLDLDAFYGEVDRCLRPGGVLAVLSYSRGLLDLDCADNAARELALFITEELWYSDKYLGPYVGEKPRWAWKFLEGLKMLYPSTSHRYDNVPMPVKMSVGRYGDYIRSTSMYAAWKVANPDKQPDLVDYVENRILAVIGGERLQARIRVIFPQAIILCSKPLNPEIPA